MRPKVKLGNYEVIKQIGEGGFGRIFQARHTLLDEYACIKQNMYSDKTDADLLKLEARLLWKLEEHHSIPSTKDFIQLGKNEYAMVMSYIQGQTLKELVEEKGPLKPEAAAWVTERLLGAAMYLHYNGVVHCDIKPDNIFVEHAKHDIKLIDFSVSSYMPKGTSKPTGYTEKYAAPELLAGKPPIPETDIFGAGVILSYALGGDDKKYPKGTPKKLIEYADQLMLFDPVDRPIWHRENPIEVFPELRLEIFGRKHSSGNR